MQILPQPPSRSLILSNAEKIWTPHFILPQHCRAPFFSTHFFSNFLLYSNLKSLHINIFHFEFIWNDSSRYPSSDSVLPSGKMLVQARLFRMGFSASFWTHRHVSVGNTRKNTHTKRDAIEGFCHAKLRLRRENKQMTYSGGPLLCVKGSHYAELPAPAKPTLRRPFFRSRFETLSKDISRDRCGMCWESAARWN